MSAFVDVDWLAARLTAHQIRIVDASWYLPTSGRNARAEHRDRHIPGAVFFDIDAISDDRSELPHMLPTPERFAQAAGALGLTADDTIVVYDGMGLFSAPRVWWTMRIFGGKDVRVLQGGLPAWIAAGLPLEAGEADPEPANFIVAFDAEAVATRTEVADALASGKAQIVDVRSRARFAGVEPEPRPGLRAGHMPGAVNLPYGVLFDEGRLKPKADLQSTIQAHGIAFDRPIVASCGSGVTAAILSLALHEIGVRDTRLYDGSWAEWGGRDDTPIVTSDAL